MIQYTMEYILCYKEAFALGMATGLLVAYVVMKKSIQEK
jgi:hypothetical protein